MKLGRNALLSCEILAAHKLRTLLSVTGIVVGIAAVIVMVSVGQSAEKRILDRIRAMGTNLIVVNAGQTRLIAGRQRQQTIVKTLTPRDAEACARECPSVTLAAPAIAKKMVIRWQAENAGTNVLGMTPEGFAIRNMELAAGQFFDAEENRARRRVAVVGPTVLTNLFGGADPLNLQIRIGRVPFTVIGVLAPRATDAYGADQDDVIVVPLQTAMRRIMNVVHVRRIFAQARTGDDLDAAEQEIRALLRHRHRLRNKPDDFTIHNQARLLETERETSRSLTLLIGSVAAISLLVGGFGILAVMQIAVRERTEEIGLRRALGALRRDIRNQFLLESTLVAGTGGSLGVLLGTAGVWLVSTLSSWDTSLSYPALAAGFLFSVTLGSIFGIYPAMRAARLEPIKALRAE